MRRFLWLLPTALATLAGGARADAPSEAAERVYAEARPKLLQIRTLVAAVGRQASLGSGFVVGADGLALTNYHVVSQYALEPATYRLEYAAPDGKHGALTLVAIDLADDLAVVRLDQTGLPVMDFDDAAVGGSLPQGERLFSMGNPLDLGFTIVEGTYNGLVERSYQDRIHFSGAINPGMSGGPAVTGEGRVAGVNVAKRLDGELVSFLVPARFAEALVARAKSAPTPAPDSFRAEVGRQLLAIEGGLYRSLAEQAFRADRFGPYQALESTAPWFTCWADTNAGQVPQPRAARETTRCSSDTAVFVAPDLTTGRISISHSYLRSDSLNAFQFATLLSTQARTGTVTFPGAQKWLTPERCDEDVVAVGAAAAAPPLRVRWCARAYRPFEGLYDVSVTAVTGDRGVAALVSHLNLQAVGYDDAVALARRFLEGVQWTR